MLAPVHAIAKGLFPSTYLDAYVNGVWSYYATRPLTVQTSLGTFTGTTSGANRTFRNASGAVIGTLTKPATSDVFACAGGMQPPNQPDQAAILAVGARVCAALNRATLSTTGRVMYDTQPTTDATKFYGQSVSNLFSKTIHAHSLNGLAYGFSYDDVGGFAPVVDQPNPSSAGMTIGSFGGGTGGNGTAVQLWDCQSYAKDQFWTWSGQTLRTLGRCVDSPGGATGNGTRLQIYDCNGTAAQRFVVR